MDIKDIDEVAESAVDGANKIAHSWRNLLVASGVLAWFGLLGTAVYSLWEGRSQVASDIYQLLVAGLDADETGALDEWNSTDPSQYPALWVCNNNSCRPNDVAKQQVAEILERLNGETGSVRSVLSLVSSHGGYRRIVAQSTALNEDRLPVALWVVPLSQPGYKMAELADGGCDFVDVSTLPEGSILATSASRYNTAYVYRCGIDDPSRLYDIRGYIGLDFSAPVGNDEYVRERMKKTAADVAEVLRLY